MEPHNFIQRSADHENLSLNSKYFNMFLEKKWWYVEEISSCNLLSIYLSLKSLFCFFQKSYTVPVYPYFKNTKPPKLIHRG